ncbi:hypothetical protein C8J57DRAFT_1464284 [Mycena rebaudengoi]|nr:hypothetical protein C8J57DRAFT_1464284 [Mycena rebaudengoi]
MPKQSTAHPPLCLLPSLSQSHTLESALQAPEPPFRLPQASLRRDLHSPPLRANFTYHSRPRPYPATRDPITPRNPSVFQRPAMQTHGVLIRSPNPSFDTTICLRPNEIRPQHRLTGESLVLTLDREPNRTSRFSAPHDALSGFDVVVFAEGLLVCIHFPSSAVNLHAFKSRTYDLTCKFSRLETMILHAWLLLCLPSKYRACELASKYVEGGGGGPYYTYVVHNMNNEFTARYLVLQTKIHHGRTSRLTHVTTHL